MKNKELLMLKMWEILLKKAVIDTSLYLDSEKW